GLPAAARSSRQDRERRARCLRPGRPSNAPSPRRSFQTAVWRCRREASSESPVNAALALNIVRAPPACKTCSQGVFERDQRRDEDIQPAQGADEKPSELVRIRLRPKI